MLGAGVGGARGRVVFRKATIPLGALERQAVKSEPGREEMLTCNLQSKLRPRSTPCSQS